MTDTEDAELVQKAALVMLDRHGRGAVAWLRREAGAARDRGDYLSAEAWDEIADAAKAQIN